MHLKATAAKRADTSLIKSAQSHSGHGRRDTQHEYTAYSIEDYLSCLDSILNNLNTSKTRSRSVNFQIRIIR